MPLGPRRVVRSTVNSNVKPTIACRIAEIHSLLGQYFQELAFKLFLKGYLQRPVRVLESSHTNGPLAQHARAAKAAILALLKRPGGSTLSETT